MSVQLNFQKTFLFQAIQLSRTVIIETIQFSIRMQLVLFNPLVGPYQVLPFRARVDLRAIAVKGYSTFPKASALLESHHEIVCVISRTVVRVVLPLCREAAGVLYSPSRPGNPGHKSGKYYLSEEMLSAFLTAPADRALSYSIIFLGRVGKANISKNYGISSFFLRGLALNKLIKDETKRNIYYFSGFIKFS